MADARAGAICFSLSVAYSATSPGRRGDEEVVDAGNLHQLDRRLPFAAPRERFQAVGVRRLDLRVERALDDQDRLANLRHHRRGIEGQDALEFRSVDLTAELRRQRSHPLPVITAS